MLRRFELTVARNRGGMRLDALVADWLATELARPVSKSIARKLIVAGAIRIDGKTARHPAVGIPAGAAVQALIDLSRMPEPSPQRGHERRLHVLYEDEDLIAVDKPAGLVIHATADPSRPDLVTLLRHLLAGRHEAAVGEHVTPYLGVHHRLDVDTSGVVLFTKQERANARLAEQFAGRDVEKVYHAIAATPRHDVPRTWQIDNRVAPTATGRRSRMAETDSDGVRAVTGFRVIEHWQAALLVEARPHTGRKHQIRAHLADFGAPIVGDLRYGGPASIGRCHASRTMLHAHSLAFAHPVSGQRVVIDCPYPADFAGMLDCLRGERADR